MTIIFIYIIILVKSSLQTLCKNIETEFVFILLAGSDLLFGIFETSSEATFTKHLFKCLAMIMLSVTFIPLMSNLLLEKTYFFLFITSLIIDHVFFRLFILSISNL